MVVFSLRTNSIIIHFLALWLVALGNEKSGFGELLDGLRLSRRDDWTSNVSCPMGLFITGYRLRHESDHIQDINTKIITGIEVICSDGISIANNVNRKAEFGKARRGEWSKSFTNCKAGFGVGISQTKSIQDYSSSSIIDFKIHCSDDPETQKLITQNEDDPEHPNQPAQGPFAQHSFKFCEAGAGVTDIIVRADSIITFKLGDRTVIKGVGMECLRVVNPSTFCTIVFGWEKLKKGITCLETDTEKKLENVSYRINCTVKTSIGVVHNDNIRNVEHAVKTYESIGLNNDEEYVREVMKERLLNSFSINTWLLTKFPDKPNFLRKYVDEQLSTSDNNFTFTESMSFENKQPLSPDHFLRKMSNEKKLKHELVLEQLVGSCSIYKILFNQFKKKHYLYFETPIKKRMTRIVLDVLNQSYH